MERSKIYKLSLTSESAWTEVKKQLTDEEGNLLKGIHIIELGNIPYDAVYDEDGEILTEAGFHTDWAVNVVFDPNVNGIEPTFLKEYLVANPPARWFGVVMGELPEDVVTK